MNRLFLLLIAILSSIAPLTKRATSAAIANVCGVLSPIIRAELQPPIIAPSRPMVTSKGTMRRPGSTKPHISPAMTPIIIHEHQAHTLVQSVSIIQSDSGLIKAATSVSPVMSATVSHMINSMIRNSAPKAIHKLFAFCFLSVIMRELK